MTELEQTIRHHLVSYLANELSLNQLTEVIARAIWNLAPEQNDEAADLIYAVQLALAERADQLLTPDEFRSQIRSLLETLTVNTPVKQTLRPKLVSVTSDNSRVIGHRRSRGRYLRQAPRSQATQRQLAVAL